MGVVGGGWFSGTQKKIADACAFRNVPLHMLPEGELSRACGREGRMAAAVMPGKLCQQMLLLLSSPGEPGTIIKPENAKQ